MCFVGFELNSYIQQSRGTAFLPGLVFLILLPLGSSAVKRCDDSPGYSST